MKNKEFKFVPLIVSALTLLLTSCLTDSDYENGVNGIKGGENNFVEVHLTSGDNTNIVSRAYDAVDETLEVNLVAIHLTSKPSSDVTITYSVLDTLTSPLIDSLVNIDGLLFTDTSTFKVQNVNNTVIIPAGQTTGYIKVKFNPMNFIGATFLYGIRINTISDSKYKLSNLTDGCVKFGIKNKYDGVYVNTGTMNDIGNGTLVGAYDYPLTVDLVTQDGSTVAYFSEDLNKFGHLIYNTGAEAYSYYGNFAPMFKFDENNNVIAVTNYWGQGTNSSKRSAILDTSPGTVNKFDPVKRVLKVSYWMYQNGAPRTHFDETFTYKKAR